MPLKKGSSRKTVSHKVEATASAVGKKGKATASRQRGKMNPGKQAVVLSLKKAGQPKKQTSDAPGKSVRLVHSALSKPSRPSRKI